MDEILARAFFDATIDESVEVTVRAWAQSPGFQRARRNTMLWSGATVTLLLLAAARPLWGAGYAIAVILAVFLLVGPLIGYLGGLAYDSSAEKRIRQYLVERLHGSTTLRCEVELRSSGLWFRQDDVEYLYRWMDVTAVEDTPISVDISAKDTVLVVRNRAFSSPAEREGFLGQARRLASTAMSGTSS